MEVVPAWGHRLRGKHWTLTPLKVGLGSSSNRKSIAELRTGTRQSFITRSCSLLLHKVVKVTTGLDWAHAAARRAYERAGFKKHLESTTYYMELE